ncbi:zinc transporter ZIP3-like [Haliotis rubra]|uniref:zinc transporter ZIP3-like n=1 Tax=Haliotis rubra TaxID=36100 RepID=UPI001EE60FDC|nr:zinc transporter ZIP3-like [Haliotis rubra]
MESLYVKIVSICVIFLVTFLGGVLPFLLLVKLIKKKTSAGDKLPLLQSFAGGIFLATCLVHLLPEARKAMKRAFPDVEYPVAEACIGIGFLMMYVTENLLTVCKEHSVKSDNTVTVNYSKNPPAPGVAKKDYSNPHVIRYGSVEESDSEGLLTSNASNGDLNNSSDDESSSKLDSGVADIQVSVQNNTSSKPEPVATNSFRSFVLLIALSLHTVFDGFVIGIQTSTDLMWTLLVAMSFHKALVAFSLGLSFVESHATNPRSAVLYLIFFSCVAPLGAGVGTAITESRLSTEGQAYAAGFLQSMACGTFMFVTFFECLKLDLSGRQHLIKVLLVIVGFGCVAGLRFALSDG